MRFLLIAVSVLTMAQDPATETRYWVDDPDPVTVTRTVGDTVEFWLILDEPGAQTYTQAEWFIRPQNTVAGDPVLRFASATHDDTMIPGTLQAPRVFDTGQFRLRFEPESFALPDGVVCKIIMDCVGAGESTLVVNRCLRYNVSDDPAVTVDPTTAIEGISPDTVTVTAPPMSYRILVVEPEVGP